ncbi:hypothetical protein BDF14DRAFT_1998314 [Spinellus fusiger]|nr:hypothetical protein BDF14DRAFT_1998314 [Spinellus fusiger]
MPSGGVTIAHQITSKEPQNGEFSMPFEEHNEEQSLIKDPLIELLSAPLWPMNEPVEDLTGEVQELMIKESMESWLQPWSTEGLPCFNGFDSQIYAQSIQLQDLFGQDDFDFQDSTAASLYDELTFVPDAPFDLTSASTSGSSSPQSSLELDVLDTLPTPITCDIQTSTVAHELVSGLIEPLEEMLDTNLKRRRDSSGSSSEDDDEDDSSSSSSDDDSSDDEKREMNYRENSIIPTTAANFNSRRRASYSSDESESESDHSTRHSPVSAPGAYAYMHKRQMEEAALDKITHQLQADKLPGILAILSSKNVGCQNNEVEIDLSCLERDQLVRLLSYVDACVVDQEGGPKVNVDDFIVKPASSTTPKKGPRTRPALRKQLKSETEDAEEAEDERAEEGGGEEEEEFVRPVQKTKKTRKPRQRPQGPMSMAHLSHQSPSPKSTTRKPKSKRSKQRTSNEQAMMSLAIAAVMDEDSIAVTKPKRRAALHKRRLLEEMLAPSDSSSQSEDENETVYLDEQMDLAVTANQTIVHQTTIVHPPTVTLPTLPVYNEEEDEDIDEDEEIDIMI